MYELCNIGKAHVSISPICLFNYYIENEIFDESSCMLGVRYSERTKNSFSAQNNRVA